MKLALFAAFAVSLNGDALEANDGLDGLIFMVLLALIVSFVTVRARNIEQAARQPLRISAV